MENNTLTKKITLEIKTSPQSTYQLKPKISTKNTIIFRNKNGKNIINSADKENINDDNLDHPQPLISDFEGREEIRKSIIIQEIKKANNNAKKNKNKTKVENINDEYFNNFTKKENKKLNEVKVKNNNDKKILRVHLNEVNNILFKNKFKKKPKETNKYINQNPFKESDIKTKNNNKIKMPQKNTISTEPNKNQISSNPNKTSNNLKDALYFIKHKPKLTLNEKDFSINNTFDSSYVYNTTNNSKVNLTSAENNNKNLNQIYISQNPFNKYYLNFKNKNNFYINNLTSTDVDSSKEKNIIKKKFFEKMTKRTYTEGGKYNNLQTTYVTSYKNINNKNIIKVNKNPKMNESNNYNLRNVILNNYNNTNNSYNNFVTKSQIKNYEKIKSPNKSNIYICDNSTKKNFFNYYKYNNTINNTNARIYTSAPKNRYYSYLNDSQLKSGKNNIKINKYNYFTGNINQTNLKYLNENNSNYDLYNNTIVYDKYNNMGRKIYNISKYYNY